MKASCECGYQWPLQKSADEYKDGPRCPKCKSRDVELQEADEEPVSVSQAAFDVFEDGEGPIEIVHAGICGPETARDLHDDYLELSERNYHVLTDEEYQEKLDSVRNEVKVKMNSRIEEVREGYERQIEYMKSRIDEKDQKIKNLQKQLDREYQIGVKDGKDEVEEKVEEDVKEILEAVDEGDELMNLSLAHEFSKKRQ